MMKLPEWAKWMARDKDGDLFAYEDKPYKEARYDEWLKEGGGHIKILTNSFDHVKWSDDEPTEIINEPTEIIRYAEKIRFDPIVPEHYNKGEIDLYESWYRTRPFSEFRAIMEAIAERYMKRDKINRLEDIDKSIYTLQRLREYEVLELEKNLPQIEQEVLE